MEGSNKRDKNAAKGEMRCMVEGKKWKLVILDIVKLLNQLKSFPRNEAWLLPRTILILEGGEKRQ